MHPALRNASREERYSPKSKKPVVENGGEVSSRTILFRNNNRMVFVDRGDVMGDMVGVTEVFYSEPQDTITWLASTMMVNEENRKALINAQLITIWSQIYKNLHAWASGKRFGEEKPKRFPVHLKDLRVRTHWLLPSMPKPVIDCYEESHEPKNFNEITFLDLELIPNSLGGWKYSAENPYVHKREKSCN